MAGHGESPLLEQEKRQSGSHRQHKQNTASNDAIGYKTHQILLLQLEVVYVLHEHDKRKNYPISVYPRYHGEQSRYIQYRHRTINAPSQNEASHAYGKRSEQRSRGDIDRTDMHEAKTQRMTYRCKNCNGGKRTPGRIGHRPKAYGRNGSQKAVKNYIRSYHLIPNYTKETSQ